MKRTGNKIRWWTITVHRSRQDKVLWHRLVEGEGDDYSMEMLGMFKLGSAILLGYIECAMNTRAYPEINNHVYRYMLGQQAGWGHLKEGYYVERRGAFEVRFKEVKSDVAEL